MTYDKANKKITPNDRAGDALAVFQAFIDTGGNAGAVARLLNGRGLRGARGKPFSSHSVLRIINNPVYRCCVHYAGRATPSAAIPRIIPPEIIEQVERLLVGNASTAPRAKGSGDAYSGRLVCAECGSRLHRRAAVVRIVKGKTYPYVGYSCPNRRFGICKSVQIARQFLDRLIAPAIHRLISDLRLPAADSQPEERATLPDNHAAAMLRTRQRIINAYIDGNLDREDYERRLHRLDAELAAMHHTHPAAPTPPPDILDGLQEIAEHWIAISEETRKRLLIALDITITVHSAKPHPRAIELHTDLTPQAYREQFQQRNRKGK